MKHALLLQTKNLVVGVTLALLPLPALAGGAVTGGATLPEQIVQEGTAVEQLGKQAQEVETQIEQYQNMVQNMVNIPPSLLGQMQGSFDQLIHLANQAQSLSTQAQNIASQFQNLNTNAASSSEMENYIQNYQQISENLSNSIDNALQQANLNPSNFATVAQAQQAVSQALQNPQSRNALLQAGAEVGQAEVGQLGQLQQTLAAQTNLQAAIAKTHLAAKNAQNEAVRELNSDLQGSGQTPTYGNPSFGWLN
ncbi:P-type conjugative transfer protein TrbJ [Acidithiobacillus sp. VAN18-1]|uniref:P-type conjugative transfer protein TrbJ n=1 Tax=Igneacidithiobacillus copahuensis TaxID=2724909 RepID=A0AAE3CJW4_9PROT|nr:P-type conjugative transfer protein TrbJ [Igneacidithiobacillus copahuensis]MBU2797114.1 P-type conjugative transfer protein TrbJ [Acidithiobacillus sp. VAN18-2]